MYMSCVYVRMRVPYITKSSEDVSHCLVHGHIYETSAQAVMGEDEQHSL